MPEQGPVFETELPEAPEEHEYGYVYKGKYWPTSKQGLIDIYKSPIRAMIRFVWTPESSDVVPEYRVSFLKDAVRKRNLLSLLRSSFFLFLLLFRIYENYQAGVSVFGFWTFLLLFIYLISLSVNYRAFRQDWSVYGIHPDARKLVNKEVELASPEEEQEHASKTKGFFHSMTTGGVKKAAVLLSASLVLALLTDYLDAENALWMVTGAAAYLLLIFSGISLFKSKGKLLSVVLGIVWSIVLGFGMLMVFVDEIPEESPRPGVEKIAQ